MILHSVPWSLEYEFNRSFFFFSLQMWCIKNVSHTWIYLKCNELYFIFHESWIEGQRFQQPYTLTYEAQCVSKITWTLYPYEIQQAVAEFHHFLHFQKTRLYKPRIVWGFFPLLHYTWRIISFFFISVMFDRYKCKVEENKILVQHFFS